MQGHDRFDYMRFDVGQAYAIAGQPGVKVYIAEVDEKRVRIVGEHEPGAGVWITRDMMGARLFNGLIFQVLQ